MYEKEQKYHKCNFCVNQPTPRFPNNSRYFSICVHRLDAKQIWPDQLEKSEFVCENNYNRFMIDGDKVVETAKELGISIGDLLTLINVSSK